MRKRILVLCLFVACSCSIQAQPDNWKQDYETMLSTDLEEKLPGLDTLIRIAMKNAPSVKYNQSLIERSQEDILLARRLWHDNISVFGNYSSGNQRFIISGANGDGNNFLNGYRYGVNVIVPLSTFTTRGSRIRAAEAQTRAAEFEKEQAELELKNRVILEYYELISAQNILKIKGLGKENAILRHEIAEQRFTEGAISLEEYTEVSESLIDSETDYEEAKKNFYTEYRQFEQLLGMSLKNLMRRR